MDKWANWGWVFRKTILAVGMEAFVALEHAERYEVFPDEQGLVELDLQIFAELCVILGTCAKGTRWRSSEVRRIAAGCRLELSSAKITTKDDGRQDPPLGADRASERRQTSEGC